MVFTIQPELLIRLVELVVESSESLQQTGSAVSLTASRDRVCVKKGKPAAESEAIVLAEGQCTLSGRRLLRALTAFRNEVSVTIEADERHLCIGRMRLPVLSYSSLAPALEEFQVFMASEIGFTPASALMHAA